MCVLFYFACTSGALIYNEIISFIKINVVILEYARRNSYRTACYLLRPYRLWTCVSCGSWLRV